MAEEETVEEVEEEEIGTDDIYHDVELEDDIAKGDTLDTTKTMIVGDIDDIPTDYDEQGEAVEEEKEEEQKEEVVEEETESEVEPPPELEMYTVKVDGAEA